MSKQEHTQLFKSISDIIKNKRIDVVIFQDYDKGVITQQLIKEVVALCNKNRVPTAIDPKKTNFNFYKNVTLFKPNLKELKEGLNVEINPSDIVAIERAIDKFNTEHKNKINFITLSEHGVFIKDKNAKKHIPAHTRNISDVSGAGDTVISVASLCLALEQPIEMIAEIANLAGGLVCENIGVIPVDKDQLLSEAISKLI